MIALAIGANTAIFTLLDSLLLRPLPIRDPERFVELRLSTLTGKDAQISYKDFEELTQRQQMFSGMFAWDDNALNDFQVGQVRWFGPRLTVSGDFYSTLGIAPFMGRGIMPEDLSPGAAPVAMISYEAWKYRLGGDSSILGKTLKVQDAPLTIVGVTPANFFGLRVGISADVTVPVTTVGLFSISSPQPVENVSWLNVAARLKPGVSPAQAQAHLNSLWPTLLADARARTRQEEYEWLAARVDVKSASTGFSSLRDRFSRPLFLLMGMVVLVLALACVNLSALMLSRAAARQYEIAVRLALGASRQRILRLLLTESLFLAMTGAAVGTVLSFWMSDALAKFVWTGVVPLSLNLRPDARILAFAISSAVLTGIVFGLGPGWQAGRHDPTVVLHHGNHGTRFIGKLGKGLVVTQLVISGVLLAGAWTVVGYLREIRSLPLGFSPEKVLMMRLINQPGAYRNLDHAAYDRELLERVSAVSGIQSASLSQDGLFNGRGFTTPVSGSFLGSTSTRALFGRVSPGFFKTVGIQIREGRDFGWHDDAQSARVAIISADLSRDLFSEADRVGSSIRLGNNQYTVVGVVDDARLGNVRDQRPAVFLPSFQNPDEILQPLLEVRSLGDPTAVAGSVRDAVQSLGREYPLKTITLQRLLDEQLIPERIIAMLATAFGLAAFLLATISLYGVVSHDVSQRSGEIGIRIALGATRRNVVKLVVRDLCALLGIGLVLAAPLAWLGVRALPLFLPGINPRFGSLLGSEMILATAAIIGAYLPTRRAIRLDPIAALHHE